MTKAKTYALAPQGVFHTIQGEGELSGLPMVFVRLAGCPVGCPECDTDYSVASRLGPRKIAEMVVSELRRSTRWAWITGGEPLAYDLVPLLESLRKIPRLKIAIATSGHFPVPFYHAASIRPDWLSVSPHDPAKWVQRVGHEVKLVPGLNGLRLAQMESEVTPERIAFGRKFVQPCDGDPSTVAECVEWVETHPGWRLTAQAHKTWGLA